MTGFLKGWQGFVNDKPSSLSLHGLRPVYEGRRRADVAGLRVSGRMRVVMQRSLSSQVSSGVWVVAGRWVASGAMLQAFVVFMRFSFGWFAVLSAAARGKGNRFWLGGYAFWF